MTPPPEEPNQLQPSASHSPTLQGKPATVSVKAGSSVLTDIGDSAITARAEHIRYNTDEEMIWQESPSPVLLLPRALKYLLLMIIIVVLCSIVQRAVAHNPAAEAALADRGIRTTNPDTPHRTARHGRKPRAADSGGAIVTIDPTPAGAVTSATAPITTGSLLLWIQIGFGLLYTLMLLGYLLKLKTTKYSASSQRLIVETGSMHTVNRPYELHHLGDAVIVKPLLLRLFGVSNLVILQPHIVLFGLRNAEYVRDILRQGGQIEAQRMDKIRWR